MISCPPLRAATFAALAPIALYGCTTSGSDFSDPEMAYIALPGTAPVPQFKPEQPDGQSAATAAVLSPVAIAEASVTAVASAVSYAATAVPHAFAGKGFSGSARERECLMRAMYFESNRSSRDGMLAVGTIVMNRVASGQYGSSVCDVVGQPRQFAPGIMSRRMQGNTGDLAALSEDILAGKRHPAVKKAMHFHQAGLKFSYPNMHYVLTAGGNSFYEKRSRRRG